MADRAEMEATIKEAIEMFRPQLQADGGDMEYVGLDDENKVHLNLTGACGGCPMAMMTLNLLKPQETWFFSSFFRLPL